LLRLNKLATIDKDLILGRLGALDEAEIDKLNENMISIFQLNIHRKISDSDLEDLINNST
jgi:hypothetical protein